MKLQNFEFKNYLNHYLNVRVEYKIMMFELIFILLLVYIISSGLGVMVFNATFNNISVISGSQLYLWRKPEYLEKTTNPSVMKISAGLQRNPQQI